MKRTFLLIAAAGACQAISQAQTSPLITQFQQAGELGAGGGIEGFPMIVAGPRIEVGKPYSATVVNETTQTYTDGTHINRKSTSVEYRDSEGRVRRESTGTGRGGVEVQNVMIQDPVAGYTYRLNPATKTAMQLQMAVAGRGGRGARGGDSATVSSSQFEIRLANAKSNSNNNVEDLGTTMVNGVVARGVRVTRVTPVNTIGNDREIRSVTEEWFSPDLNLMIKSVSTDPRFGTTTYQLLNITRSAPDASLFQVPADYKTSTGGRRGPQN